VNPVNDAPVAANQNVSITPDTPQAVTLAATDADGDTLTYAALAAPAHGSLSGTAPNLTYTPAAGYTGADSFTFQAHDGTVASNTATVSLTVQHSLSLTPSATATVPGATFSLRWTAPSGQPVLDWVALVPAAQYNTSAGTISNYVSGSWAYTGGATTGTHTFTLPTGLAGGTYYGVYLDDDSLEILTVTSAITVTAPTPPTISLVNPGAVGPYTGTPLSVPLTATAADSDGTVAKVEFYVNGSKIGEDLTAPYNGVTWTVTGGGTYSLTAKATDNSGLITTSSAVSVTVAVDYPITVSSSASTALAGASLTLSWTAPAGRPFLDWVVLVPAAQYNAGAGTISGYVSGSWSYTGGRQTGSYLVTLPSDLAGGTYYAVYLDDDSLDVLMTSSAITVTAPTPPTVSLDNPGAVGPYAGTPLSVPLTATAADADGTVAKVEFYVGGTKIGEDLTAPYDGVSWSVTSAGTYSLTARATDNQGNTTTSSAVVVTVTGTVSVTVTGSAATVTRGSTFGITWAAPAGRPSADWVCLVRADQLSGAAITGYVSGSWVYTRGNTSGTHQFVVPSGISAGTYYAVYLANNTTTVLAQSTAITVN
jgi:hypothetical protein